MCDKPISQAISLDNSDFFCLTYLSGGANPRGLHPLSFSRGASYVARDLHHGPPEDPLEERVFYRLTTQGQAETEAWRDQPAKLLNSTQKAEARSPALTRKSLRQIH